MRASVPAAAVLPAALVALVAIHPVVVAPGLGVEEVDVVTGGREAGRAPTPLGDAAATVAGGPSTGESVATGDVNGDGATDLLVGVPFDDAGGPNAGAAYLFLGPVAGDRRLGDADATLVGAAPGDWAGFAVAVADVDADGRGEAVVGAPLRDGGAGGVYVVDAPRGTVALGDAPVVPGPVDARLGRAVAGAGDVAGGPGADVLVGAPAAREAAGVAYLLSRRAFEAGEVAAATAAYRGAAAGDRAGWAVAAGDFDDDGRPEPVVGARGAGDGGAVYVLAPGERDAASLPEAATTTVTGPAGGGAGWAVTTGDVGGDGVPDLVVGAPLAGGGAAFVVRGGDLPARASLGSTEPLLAGRAAGDRAGWAVAVGGGDCDGGGDVLVGAPRADGAGTDAGAVYRVGADGTVTATYAGAPGDYAGYRLVTGGDVTGDGRADAVVGAPGNRSSAAAGGGLTAAAYVVGGDCSVDAPSVGPTGTGSGATATPSLEASTDASTMAATTTASAEASTGPSAGPARKRGLPGAGVAVAAAAVVLAAALVAHRGAR